MEDKDEEFKDPSDLNEIEMISGKKEQSKKIVARLIIAFLDIFIKRKNILDKNNEIIKEKYT